MTATTAEKKRTFTLTPTETFHGACLYVVDPENPAKPLSRQPVEIDNDFEADFPVCVGFAPACVQSFDLSGHGRPILNCKCPGPHGHILLQCEDGSALVQAPIASRAMLEEVLKSLEASFTENGGFKRGEIEGIRHVVTTLTEHLLPDALTPNEKQWLSERTGDKIAGLYGWWS